MTTTLVPAPSTGIAFLTAWIAVRPASASAAMSVGCSDGSSLTTERALVSRNSAKPPSRLMPGNEPFTQCMSSPARHGAAQPAGDERVHDHRVADLDVGHAGADLVDPARVLVAGRVGQLDLGLLRPLALLDVQVGAAQPRRADLHDHVERAGDLRLVDLLELQRLVVRVQARGLHAATSSFVGTAVADVQQRAAQAAVGLQAQADQPRAPQPASAGPPALSGLPSPRHEAPASSGPRAARARARSSTQRSRVGAGREVGDAQRRDRLRRRAVAEQGLAHPRLAGDQRLALEQLAQRVQRRPSVSPGNASAKPPPRATRRVDLGARVVVLEHDARRSRPPATDSTAARASAAIRKAKFGAHCGVGSRRRTATSPPSDTAHEPTKPSAVIGSSSSGS